MGRGEAWWEGIEDRAKGDPAYVAELAALVVATQVHRRLEDEGRTQTEFAKQLGVTKGYVSQILGGATNMTILTLAKLACALDVAVKDLLSTPVDPTATHVLTEVKTGNRWELSTTSASMPGIGGGENTEDRMEQLGSLADASGLLFAV